MASPSSAAVPRVREPQGEVKLTREEFNRRLGERSTIPRLIRCEKQIEQLMRLREKNYEEFHRNSRKRKAGPRIADTAFKLPLEWLDTRQRIFDALTRAPN